MGICHSTRNKFNEQHNHSLKMPQKIPLLYNKYSEKELYLLDRMFKDLAKRSPNDTISKQTFLEYFGLPGILGDRLFAVFDTDHNQVISFNEFLSGLARYNQGSLQDKIYMLFEIYDMNSEQQVNREELSLILYTVTTPTTSIFHANGNESKHTEQVTRIANVPDVTKQTVEKTIKDAFEHYDTNHDGLLSKQQFTNWIKQNPATLGLLEHALSKHKWSLSTPDIQLNSSYNYKHIEPIEQKCGILYNAQCDSGYYVVKNDFLYTFAHRKDINPVNVIFIVGWYINEINQHNQWYGIELTPPGLDDWKNGPYCNKNKNKKKKKSKSGNILYCKTKKDRDDWIECLQIAAATVAVQQYYDFGRILGKSYFTVVREATHKATGTKYAIKIVEKANIDDAQSLNLRNEVAMMRLVKHPSIIRLWDVFADKKCIYMVMTLAPYGNLFARWKIRRRFGEDVARIIIWKLLDAIQYLHALGIVHRDLKPENILCLDESNDSKIVISDFGLSKFATPEAEMTMPCGTLCYVAPEVLNKKAYGKKVDLWALGCIMHLLLRGVLPFDGHSENEIRHKTINKELSLTSAKWNVVSQDAKDLIKKLLIKNPSDRISLHDALKHKWFQNNKDKDKLYVYDVITTSMHILSRTHSDQKKNKNNLQKM